MPDRDADDSADEAREVSTRRRSDRGKWLREWAAFGFGLVGAVSGLIGLWSSRAALSNVRDTRALQADDKITEAWGFLAGQKGRDVVTDAREPMALNLAQKSIRDAFRLAPDNPDVHRLQGIYFSLLGPARVADAEKAYRDGLALAPSDARLHNALGVLLESRQERQLAEQEYRQAIHDDPSETISYVNLGRLLDEAGRSDEAMRNFDEALRLYQQFGYAYLERCRALYRRGSKEQALRDCRQAAILDPQLAAAFNMLGVMQMEVDKPSEAEPNFRRAVQLSPSFEPARRNLARALKMQGKPDEVYPLGIAAGGGG